MSINLLGLASVVAVTALLGNSHAREALPSPRAIRSIVLQDTTSRPALETMPEFPGGIGALYKYIKRNIRLKPGKDPGDPRVTVSFIIGVDGSVSNAEVYQGLNGACDAEALRLVRAMPNWKPGAQNGKPVPVRYLLPIAFSPSNHP